MATLGGLRATNRIPVSPASSEWMAIKDGKGPGQLEEEARRRTFQAGKT
jgi:hypothetical protein